MPGGSSFPTLLLLWILLHSIQAVSFIKRGLYSGALWIRLSIYHVVHFMLPKSLYFIQNKPPYLSYVSMLVYIFSLYFKSFSNQLGLLYWNCISVHLTVSSVPVNHERRECTVLRREFLRFNCHSKFLMTVVKFSFKNWPVILLLES
jgi:hypothetical protein